MYDDAYLTEDEMEATMAEFDDDEFWEDDDDDDEFGDYWEDDDDDEFAYNRLWRRRMRQRRKNRKRVRTARPRRLYRPRVSVRKGVSQSQLQRTMERVEKAVRTNAGAIKKVNSRLNDQSEKQSRQYVALKKQIKKGQGSASNSMLPLLMMNNKPPEIDPDSLVLTGPAEDKDGNELKIDTAATTPQTALPRDAKIPLNIKFKQQDTMAQMMPLLMMTMNSGGSSSSNNPMMMMMMMMAFNNK